MGEKKLIDIPHELSQLHFTASDVWAWHIFRDVFFFVDYYFFDNITLLETVDMFV